MIQVTLVCGWKNFQTTFPSTLTRTPANQKKRPFLSCYASKDSYFTRVHSDQDVVCCKDQGIYGFLGQWWVPITAVSSRYRSLCRELASLWSNNLVGV